MSPQEGETERERKRKKETGEREKKRQRKNKMRRQINRLGNTEAARGTESDRQISM